MARRIPTIRPSEPDWLKQYVRRGEVRGYFLSPEEATRLCDVASRFAATIKTREDDLVFYPAREGDIAEAIRGFGLLLRLCRQQARKANGGTMLGWCAARMVGEVSQQLQARVCSYLQVMMEPDDQENRELLARVVKTYGWHKTF